VLRVEDNDHNEPASSDPQASLVDRISIRSVMGARRDIPRAIFHFTFAISHHIATTADTSVRPMRGRAQERPFVSRLSPCLQLCFPSFPCIDLPRHLAPNAAEPTCTDDIAVRLSQNRHVQASGFAIPHMRPDSPATLRRLCPAFGDSFPRILVLTVRWRAPHGKHGEQNGSY
jgi:hypothetical protein